MNRAGEKINRYVLYDHKCEAKKRQNIDDLNRSGIYAIVNLQNQHKYVGQSKCLGKRRKDHFLSLKKKQAYKCVSAKCFQSV